MNASKWSRLLALAVVGLLGITPAVFGQASTGNLFVQVTDTEGAALPGVTVEVTGQGAPRLQVTDAQGQVRFLGIDPGTVQVNASLEGFSTVEYPGVVIRVNYNTTIEVQLSSAIEETITVTSESPLLDEKKIQSGTTITGIELEKIPTARDPWSVLSQTPGVSVDRINVGGNESGQQSVFRGPGVSDDENSFLVDGVEITDMAAIGASPTYYDFDQFAEMQFGTGGSDATKSSSGVSVNLVTKRGTNEFRGSARFLVTEGGGFFGDFLEQDEPSIATGDLGPGQTQDDFTGNLINRVQDIGFEGGGPVVRDKFWAWGSYGQNDISNLTGANRTEDRTVLTNTAVKLNAQLSANNSAVGSWNNGDKQKFGRNASPTRPAPTTWDQRGPSAVMKFEDTHVFSSNLFLTGTWSKVDGGFSLTSKQVIADGIGNAPQSHQDINGVWQGSFWSGFSSRPSTELKADGSYFFNTGSTNHELKFGARFREFETTSEFTWPGGGNTFSLESGFFADTWNGADIIVAQRGIDPPITQEYTSAWLQDTISFGSLTLNVGLRYDDQSGTNDPVTIQANPFFPDVLPAIDYGGADAGFDWTTVSPRIGLTYALGEERKTLLRASLSSFPDQLQTADVQRINPAANVFATGYWIDANDNQTFEPGETVEFLFGSGVDLDNPTSLVSPNETDPGLDPAITQEFTASVEHAFLPEFVAGASITVRNVSDILEERQFIRDAAGNVRTATVGDYVFDGTVEGTLPDGSTASIDTFALDPVLEFTGGDLLLNGSRERDYLGYGLNFTKRLSNRWMARGYFQFGEAEWDVPAGYLNNTDPNRCANTSCGLGSDIDGGLYVVQAAGSGAKANVFVQSSWQWNLNGMYQVAPDRPWGFNVAANLFGREGYTHPYFFDNVGGSDGVTRDILAANEVDDFRVDDIFTVDLRLEKEFAATGNVGFTVSLDAFNLFDEAYVLQRERDITPSNTQADWLRETLSPRVYRIGVRLNWR